MEKTKMPIDKLVDAIKIQNIEIISSMIKENPDIVNEIDYFNWTPLMHACHSSKWYNEQIIKILIDAKSNVNYKVVSDMTPLLTLCSNTSKKNITTDIIQKFIDAKVDLNAKNSKGITPLMFAAFGIPRLKLMAFMMNSGATFDISTYYNMFGEKNNMLQKLFDAKDDEISDLKKENEQLKKENAFLQEKIDLTPSMLLPFDDDEENEINENGNNNKKRKRTAANDAPPHPPGGILYHKTMIRLYEQQEEQQLFGKK